MLNIPHSDGLPVAELRESAEQYLEAVFGSAVEAATRLKSYTGVFDMAFHALRVVLSKWP